MTTALVTIEQRDVAFYDDVITAVLVDVDGRPVVYVPLRPLCDYLGVDWSSQRQRINRDPVLSDVVQGVVVTTTPSPSGRGGGPQEAVCIPLDYLNGWMFGINASRVKDEIRDRLIRYQRECYRVLADAFGAGMTVQPTSAGDEALVQLHNMALVIAATTREMLAARQLAQTSVQMAQANSIRLDRAAAVVGNLAKRVTAVEAQIRAGSLTEEQAAEIKKRVNLISQEMAKRDPGRSHYQAVYAALSDEAGVTSYKAIPPKSYETAVAFLDNWLVAIRHGNE